MKMKYNLNLMAILLVAGCFSACDSLLDMAPEDTLSPDTYFANETQLELWTNQFYSQFDAADDAALTEAEDVVDTNLGTLLMGQRMASNESGWSWTMLRKINYYLQNSYHCKSESVRNEYDGVAYFMRAYFYYIKVRRYGDVPWYNQVLDSDDTEYLYQARDDRGLVMDSIMSDLDKAIDMLPTAKDKLHVTKWTALAFKSRAALYEGTYRKYRNMDNADKYLKLAAEAAENFIANSGYKLYTSGAEPYRTLFNSIDCVDQEVILTRKYGTEANVMHSIQFNIINQRQGLSKRMMNHYLMADGSRFTEQEGWETMEYVDEVKNRDPRLEQTVLCPGYVQIGNKDISVNDLTSITGYRPIKFVNASAYDGSLKAYTDFPLFRAPEVYLNFAEAKAELGTLTQDDLDKSVNVIRARANMPSLNMVESNANPDALLKEYYPNATSSSNTGVILEIRRERVVELVMEGFHLWDMFRWKEGQQFTKPFYGMYFPGPGQYDMDGDGTTDGKNDLLLYTDSKGSFKGTAKKIGSEVILSEGDKGYLWVHSNITVSWDETRDYLWPIPADERVLTGGVLTQNPGWTDSTNFD